MDLEKNPNDLSQKESLDEETKIEKSPELTEITTEKENPSTTNGQSLNDKEMEKISEEPVKQKKLLKHIGRKQVKASYNLQNNLAAIPRKVLNRRYAKLQELIEGDSDYFEEENVRNREPILYFVYVGRYIREVNDSNKSLAEVLLEQMQINDWKADLMDQLKESGYLEEINLDEEITLSKQELEDNVDEMMRLLHDRFIAGLDKNINYTEIDDNELLDDEKVLRQDAEDHYFDDEENESVLAENQESEYTGIQDY